MTYKDLYEKAEWKLWKGEITSGEFDEMTKPLDEEIRPQGEWIKEPIYLCHYGCDGCYKDKKYADPEWCSTCEFWRAEDFRYVCSICNKKEEYQPRFCPNCGSDNRKRGDEK